MTKKQRRWMFLAAGLVIVGGAVSLSLVALEKTIVYFYSPSDVAEAPPPVGEKVRVGGLVVEGSVQRFADGRVSFRVTDMAAHTDISYYGDLPDLFREGQGIVAEGAFDGAALFQAETVLAKHDETYMPPEVADALKASGQWKPDETGYNATGYDAGL